METDAKEAAVNTITIEGILTDDPDLSFAFGSGTPACVIRLEVPRPLTRPPYVYDPFFVLVVCPGALGCELADRTRRRYTVSVTGRLDSVELPTDDGSHLCQHVIVATSFEVVSDVPF
jgi:single-stranded DNA-binding protein